MTARTDTPAVSGGAAAGANRRLRMLLRLSHLAGTASYVIAVVGVCAGISPLVWCSLLLAVCLFKWMLLRRHLSALRLTAGEALLFLVFLPLHDLSYVFGLVSGLWSCICSGTTSRPIR